MSSVSIYIDCSFIHSDEVGKDDVWTRCNMQVKKEWAV